MVIAFIDTNVVVDLLRGYSPAQRWITTQTDIGVTPLVVLETIEGAPNKIKQTDALKLLRAFQLVYLIPDDFDWAITQASAYKLSHNIGMTDCLIASVCHRLQVPLYTRNLKHFKPLLGRLAQQPYN
jgi:predicted nucleic acid-binding protein